MAFTALRLYQFRNFIEERLSFKGKEIFLIGANGQGKSNFLEAIYLLCYGSSFRTKKDELLINLQKNEASICGSFLDNNLNKEIKLVLKRKAKKEIYVDNKRVTDRKEILLKIPCVIFSPNDLEFVQGEPFKKRIFINQTLCLYDQNQLNSLQRYKKILLERNSALRQHKKDLLEIYNKELVKTGFIIQQKREELLLLFNSIFKVVFSEIAGLKGEIKIIYSPSWKNCTNENQCLELLERNEERDLLFQATTTGPHRDHFYYFYEGRDFAKVASTGQIRLLAVILRIAQAIFFIKCSGHKPILLIDDVLLELDHFKRERCLKNLPDYEQAFFTFLPDERHENYGGINTERYLILDGKIQRWKKQEIF